METFELTWKHNKGPDIILSTAGTINDWVVKYTIMESKVYEFDWKYSIIREVYMIIFWTYAIIDLKLYYPKKL